MSMLGLTENDFEFRLETLERHVQDIVAKLSRQDLPKKPARPPFVIGSGLSDIVWLDEPVTFNNVGGSSVAWTTYNAFEDVPELTRVLILDATVKMGALAGDLIVKVRRSSADPELEFVRVYTDLDATSGQILCPVMSFADGRTFDYKVDSPGSASWTLRIIGYIKAQYMYGPNWDAASTGVTNSGGSSTGGGGKPGLDIGGFGT